MGEPHDDLVAHLAEIHTDIQRLHSTIAGHLAKYAHRELSPAETQAVRALGETYRALAATMLDAADQVDTHLHLLSTIASRKGN